MFSPQNMVINHGFWPIPIFFLVQLHKSEMMIDRVWLMSTYPIAQIFLVDLSEYPHIQKIRKLRKSLHVP